MSNNLDHEVIASTGTSMTPFAKGFVDRCRQSGLSTYQIKQAALSAIKIADVAEELRPVIELCEKTADAEKQAGPWDAAGRFAVGVGKQLFGKGGKGAKGIVERVLPSFSRAGQRLTPRMPAGGGWAKPQAQNMLKRIWNAPITQPVRGGATGWALGAGADSIAGLAGYDTNFSDYGMALGGLSRLPWTHGLKSVARGGGAAGRFARKAIPYAEKARQIFTLAKPPGKILKQPFKGLGQAYSKGGVTGAAGNIARGVGNQAWKMLGWKNSPISKAQAALITGGIGADWLHDAATARGEEAAIGKLDEYAKRFGYENANQAMASPMGQFMQGYGQGGLMQGISQGWSSLPMETKMQLLASGAGILGGGGLMAAGHTGAGAGLMGLGGLGVAHGLGAFGNNYPGSWQNKMQGLDPEMQSQLQPHTRTPEFQTATPAEQSDFFKMLVDRMRNGGTELERASG